MNWPKKGSVLAAAWFATVLCLLTMFGGVLSSFLLSQPTATNTLFPAFFSFLPVVFFMIAHEYQRAEKTIEELRQRIETLEASTKIEDKGRP